MLELSNIPTAKVCLLTYVLINIKYLLTLRIILMGCQSRNDIETPSEDTMLGFGCFSAAC